MRSLKKPLPSSRGVVTKHAIGLIRLYLCAWILALTIPCRVAADGDSHDASRSAIMEVLKNQQTAWNRGNVEEFLEGYWHSPDLTFSGTSGISRGWDAVRERYRKNYADRESMGQLEF